MRPTRPLVAALVIAGLGAGLGACGQDSPNFVLRFQRRDQATLKTATDILNKRLTRAKVSGRARVDGATVRVVFRDARRKNLVLKLATTRGTLEFRPVLASTPPPCHAPQVDLRENETVTTCPTLAPPVLDGSSVARASAGAPFRDEQWRIDLEFTPDGAAAFDRVAGRMYQKDLAIVVDDEAMSAPTINAQHYNGRATIIGGGTGFAEDEARALAASFGSAPLPAEVVGVECFSGACGSHS